MKPGFLKPEMKTSIKRAKKKLSSEIEKILQKIC